MHAPSFPRHLASASSSAILVVAVALFAASCAQAAYFGPEYHDPTANFIQGIGFGLQAAPSSDPALPGVWDFAYRGQTGNSHAYMLLADTGTTVGSEAVAGLPSDTAVYRLSIENLVPDGDFESSAVGSLPASWNFVYPELEPATVPSASVISSGSVLNGNTLDFSMLNGWYFRYLFGSVLLDRGASPPYAPENASYLLRFSFRKANEPFCYFFDDDIADHIEPIVYDTITNIAQPVRIGSGAFRNESLPYGLFIGNEGSLSGQLDDLRVVRDIDLSARLRLRMGDTYPTLVSGFYEFSLWVKPDPSSYDPQAAGARNPYKARYFSFYLSGDEGASASMSVYKQYALAMDGSWTRLSLRVPEDSALQVDAATDSPVLAISISPTALAGNEDLIDAGTVLVAAPTLTFHLNGY